MRCAFAVQGTTYVPLCVSGDGNLAAGASCSSIPLDAGLNFDDCFRGLVCVQQTCRRACEPDGGVCAGATACVGYTYGTNVIGGCVPTCNPVTQKLDDPPFTDCGVGRGCYGKVKEGLFFCAPNSAVPAGHGFVPSGQFINRCAPGTQLMTSVFPDPAPCVATCAPAETSKADASFAQGQPPLTCPSRDAGSSECRFWWYLAVGGDGGNAWGYCHDPALFGAGPRCSELDAGDHRAFGCAPR